METSISLFFREIEDPRIERHKLYPLEEILLVALCSIVCGGEGYEDMKLFGESRLEWLQKIYPFKNGIASEDTYRRLFMLLDTQQFGRCFANWMESLHGRVEGLIAIDGKAARGSQGERQSPVHMVSAWCHEHGVVMGQVATDSKSNEIEAIPRLLELLDLKGSVVTLDAMGCQRKIAEKIIDGGGDYVIALKGNQTSLHEDVKDFFEGHRRDDFKEAVFEEERTEEDGHGRNESRHVRASADFDGALIAQQKKWKGLRSVIQVNSTRRIGAKSQQESRYYLSSLDGDASKLAETIRAHWTIENQLHWSLDVTFGEDRSRIRKGSSPQNVSIIRQLALSLLKADPQPKLSMRRKVKKAAWNDAYLTNVIAQKF